MVWALHACFNLDEDLMRVYGVRMASGALCFIVKFADDGIGRANLPAYTEECFGDFIRELSLKSDTFGSWTHLGCCEQQVHFNGRDWLDTLDCRTNVSCFGESRLLSTFREEIVPYLAYKRYNVGLAHGEPV